MNDFRQPIYKFYVSRFKKNSEVIGARSTRLKKYQSTNFISPILQYSKAATILDLGCGSGQLLESLQEAGYTDVHGVDISEEQVASAKKRNLPANCQDIFEHLENVNNQYDIIYAIDLIEHFTREELGKLGTLLSKNLKAGGLIILQTPNGKSPFALRNIYGDFTHLCIFSDESIAQWLECAGFSEIKTTSPLPAPIHMREHLRCFLRKILLMLTKSFFFIMTGRKETTLGENLLTIAKKSKLHQFR